MAYDDNVKYLADPRGPTADEIDYLWDQAKFYKDFLEGDPRYILIPACRNCAQDKFTEDEANFMLICDNCGFKMSKEFLFGRIAKR